MEMLSAVRRAGHTLTVDVALLDAARQLMGSHLGDERGLCERCGDPIPCRLQVAARRRLVLVGELP